MGNISELNSKSEIISAIKIFCSNKSTEILNQKQVPSNFFEYLNTSMLNLISSHLLSIALTLGLALSAYLIFDKWEKILELLSYFKKSDLTLGKLLKDGFSLAGETYHDHITHLKATRTLVNLLELRGNILKDIKEAAYYSKAVRMLQLTGYPC